MWRLRARTFKQTVGALAILGAILNAWVLTVHITSVALAGLKTNGDGIVVCHQGGLKYVDVATTPEEKPASKKSCPICSGLAALHVGIVSEPQLHVWPVVLSGPEVNQLRSELTVDHRPLTIFNRGPPLLS